MLLQNAAAALPERPLSISDASAGQRIPFMSTSEQSVASGSSDIWTVQRILQWTAEFLRQKGVESPRVEAPDPKPCVARADRMRSRAGPEPEPGQRHGLGASRSGPRGLV